MSAALAFADRCRREILRDPLSLIFGIGLPLVLLTLMSLLQQSVPTAIFPIERFAPGMAVFSLTFLTLFGGQLLAADRSTAFLARVLASPLRTGDYLLAYTLPLLPLGLAQGAICLAAALCFGLPFGVGLLRAELALIPAVWLYISLGLLFGVCFTHRQLGPAASIVIQAASLLSGIWFDLDLIGGAFGQITRCLPFWHAVQGVQDALAGDLPGALLHAAVTLGWGAALYASAAILFGIRTRRGA